MGIISYQHTFSWNVLADLRGMVRDNANDFTSNADSTPIEIFQHNRFREGYFRGGITVSHGRHEIKAGVESDNMFLHENFNYNIKDPSQYDPDRGGPLQVGAAEHALSGGWAKSYQCRGRDRFRRPLLGKLDWSFTPHCLASLGGLLRSNFDYLAKNRHIAH
jgi:hypothetical protein